MRNKIYKKYAQKIYKLGNGAWQKLKATTKKAVKDIYRASLSPSMPSVEPHPCIHAVVASSPHHPKPYRK